MKTKPLSIFKNHKKAYVLLYNLFKKIPDTRASNKSIPLADALMSLFAIFALKFSSLLKFEESRNDDFASNLTSLFGVEKIPTDSQMRTIIDKIPHKHISSLFKYLFSIIQRGKVLTDFEFMRKNSMPYYLVAVDGTQYFSSKKIHCPSCLIKKHRNNTISYYHQALAAVLIHPKKKQVIPLATEGIIKQDGVDKNDCEVSAFKRLAKRLEKEHPKLKMIICGDALYANGKTVKTLRQHKMSYILNVKPKGNRKLFGHVGEYERRQGFCHYNHRSKVIGDKVKKQVDFRFRYANAVRLDNSPSSKEFKVNFLECVEVKKWRGKRDKNIIEEKKSAG